jgi:Putative beta-barrel porin-2, OmpL-like. bbp2
MEGNYTKDQFNYSRSYWFDFLPFYHMGIRASYPVNDRFSLNDWIVNGTNQAEGTNAFKDELFSFTAKPAKSVTWVVNYYLGQEHPDRTPVPPFLPIPVQPGLSFQAIIPAPDGRLPIFDSYVNWQATTYAAAPSRCPERNHRNLRLQTGRRLSNGLRIPPRLLQPTLILQRHPRRPRQTTNHRHHRPNLVVGPQRRRLVTAAFGNRVRLRYFPRPWL